KVSRFSRDAKHAFTFSYAFHSPRAAFERDRARDAELIAAGYRVIRVTWRQLVEEPEATVAQLAGALRP
ncbi:MAG: hypothetical protein QOF55_1265, partial [Thermoleophilaceae bacterium]|nr:hypothetical protein [Thermoleophilaceae bacterium]